MKTATSRSVDEELTEAFAQFPERTRDRTRKQLIELVQRGIDLVQHLDPAGVAPADLRECLLIQIAAQQAELSTGVCAPRTKRMAMRICTAASRQRPRQQLEERRRSMEVAAQIVQSHLQLLQKRDVKDLARRCT